MPKVLRLPSRSKVKPPIPGTLLPCAKATPSGRSCFQKLDKQIAGFEKFRGKLGESAKTLAACLKFDSDFDRLGERVGGYAHLKATEDQANSTYQAMVARFQNLATRASQAASYIRPEILALPKKTLDQYLAAKELAPFKLVLERIIRYKPYTLSPREEEILAMQGEMAEAASKAFRQLLDADLKFGLVKNEKGEQVELSNATFSKLLVSPERSVRKNGVSPVLRAVQGAREHAGRDADRLDPEGRLLRQGPRLQDVARVGPVSRQRAADGLRQPDRRGPQAPAGRAPLLRRAAAEDEAHGHSPLRHLRADPQRPGDQADLEAGGEAGDRRPRAAGRASIAARWRRGCSTAAGAIAIRTRASRAGRFPAARSTARRTS